MYYAEKVINGVLHFQVMPDSEWHVMTPEMLTKKVLKLQQELDEIKAKIKQKTDGEKDNGQNQDHQV